MIELAAAFMSGVFFMIGVGRAIRAAQYQVWKIKVVPRHET